MVAPGLFGIFKSVGIRLRMALSSSIRALSAVFSILEEAVSF